MKLSIEEQAQIRRAVAAVEDRDTAGARSSPTAMSPLWAEDLIVNAPNGRVVQVADVRARAESSVEPPYATFERHREATIVRRQCAVTMGYEVVVPKGNGPNAGRKVRRRYTNVYSYEDGEWRLLARQTTDVAVE